MLIILGIYNCQSCLLLELLLGFRRKSCPKSSRSCSLVRSRDSCEKSKDIFYRIKEALEEITIVLAMLLEIPFRSKSSETGNNVRVEIGYFAAFKGLV